MGKYFIALLSILMGSIAQLLLKKGSGTFENINIKSLINVFTNPYLLSGLFCYAISALFWINVLSKMKLSVAYPLVSLGYIFTMLFACFFLNENIRLTQIAGLVLILSGIVFITR